MGCSSSACQNMMSEGGTSKASEHSRDECENHTNAAWQRTAGMARSPTDSQKHARNAQDALHKRMSANMGENLKGIACNSFPNKSILSWKHKGKALRQIGGREKQRKTAEKIHGHSCKCSSTSAAIKNWGCMAREISRM